MMEGVESKKITTKFGNKVKFCTSGGCITPRKKWGTFYSLIHGNTATGLQRSGDSKIEMEQP